MEKYKKKNRIAEALTLKGMKQVDLVEKTGISKGTITNWVSQKYQPKQDSLIELARALDVSEMWLAGYDVPMERPAEQVKADKLLPLVHRLRKDDELFNLCITLTNLNSDQLADIKSKINELTLSDKQPLN